MLIRLSLIIAIVAGLAIAGLNFVKVKEKVTTLQTNLATETSEKTKAQNDLATTRNNLDKTTKELDATKTELTSTKDERDKAVTEATTQSKKATKLAEDLSRVTQERNDAQTELAQWNATGLKPDQIKGMIAQLKQTSVERDAMIETNKIRLTEIRTLTNELNRYRDPDRDVVLPPNLKGKVLVADPKWDFVVLDFGQNQGALEYGKLLVNRNGRLVAKVQIRSVQADRCIANVLPGWKLGEVMEGDQVIP